MRIDSLEVKNCVERVKVLKPDFSVTVIGDWASDLNLGLCFLVCKMALMGPNFHSGQRIT